MVKTVTLTADTPQKITFEGAYPYFWIDNKSASDVYASVGGTPEADADDTYTVAAGSQLRISGGVGNDGITLLGEGKVQIIASTIAACPFKSAPAVGGGGGSDTVDEFLSITSPNPVQNKAIKAELDKKANSKHSHNVADISDFPDIPDETAISGMGFTKNSGDYSKPNGGIPKTDLTADVQASLDKANTALQSYTEKYTGTYSKPSNGIPKADLSIDVQASLEKADTALQKHQSLADCVKTTDSRLSDARTPTAHTHDDRYYTESEIDIKLSSKAGTSSATTSSNGLMTKEMVTKLNGIATNANNYTHPATSGNKHIPSGGSSGQILRWSADGTAVWEDEISDTDYQMQCGAVTVAQSTSSVGLDITFPKKFKSAPLIFLSGSPPSASTGRKYPIIATFSELTAEGFKLTSWLTSSSGLTALNQNITGEVNWAAFGEIEEDENG